MPRGVVQRITCQETLHHLYEQQQISKSPCYEMELSPSSTLVNDGRDRYIFSIFDNNLSNNPISQQMAALGSQNVQISSNNGSSSSNNNKRLTTAFCAAGGSMSPVLNRSLSTPSVNVIGQQPAPANGAPRIFIANLDYAMKVAEYVPVLRKQLEKHGIEIMDGECYQDKADPTGRNRYAILTVANEEQVRLAKSKSNEVKVGYRKVWIYDDAELTPAQRDDILRQLRDQLAKQQAVKIVSGPKPLPPYQQPSSAQQSAPVSNILHHQQQQQIDAIGTPPEDAGNRRRFSTTTITAPYMRQSTMLGSSASTANIQSYVASQQSSCITSTAMSTTTTTASAVGTIGSSCGQIGTTNSIPTVEITPDDDYDLSNVSTPPSLFQIITPRSSDTSAYSSGTSPTPPDNNNNSNNSIKQYTTPAVATTGLGARAIVGRRRGSAMGRLETPERDVDSGNRHRLFSGEAEDDVMASNADISLIKTHGEMFLDYALSSTTSVTSKQQAINKFRQLINDIMSTKSFTPNNEQGSTNNSFLFYVMSVVNDLRKTGCDRVCFNKHQPQDLPVQLADWNGFLSVPINGAPLELYLRMHPCVTIMRLKASHSAAGNSAPLWHMTLALDCEKWAYASNFWLESSWPSDFVTVFQMFVAEVDEPTATGSLNGICRSVCLERAHFDGIVEDLEELERLGWLHLLGSEYDDGSPRLVGLTLPGYAALWRHAVDRRIHTVQALMSASAASLMPSPIVTSCCSSTADIDGRQWLCIADLLRMADEDELAGLHPFGLFAFVDGFTFQPQWVLAEQFSFRVAPPSSNVPTTPDVSITCNSQRCAKRRRLAAITELLTQVPPGTPTEEPVPFDLEQFMTDAFAGCRRFSSSSREDVIRKLPFSFQVLSFTPSVVHVARPDRQDKSGAHLRRLSWLAMCLHAAGTLFFSLDELSLLYSRLFPSPGAGPLLLESLIELCQGPLPILACDSTSAVGLTPLGLAASSIRQALMASVGNAANGGGLVYASPVSRLVEEWGASVEDVLEVLTTTDPNSGPAWLQMLTVVSGTNDNDASSPSVSVVVKLRNLFRQSVSPDVLSFITGARSSSSMLNIAIMTSSSSSQETLRQQQQQQQNGENDDDFERLDGRRVPAGTLGVPTLSAQKRRASAPLIRPNLPSSLSIAGALMATPPKSPPKSLLLRLGGCLLIDNNDVDDDDVDDDEEDNENNSLNCNNNNNNSGNGSNETTPMSEQASSSSLLSETPYLTQSHPPSSVSVSSELHAF